MPWFALTWFIDVLCDTDKQPVFSVDEDEQVRGEIYGPVHSRLLKQALDLINNAEEARKVATPGVSSRCRLRPHGRTFSELRQNMTASELDVD